MNAKISILSELMAFIRCKFPDSLEDEESNALLPVYYYEIKQGLEDFETFKNKIKKMKEKLKVEINLAKYQGKREREYCLESQLEILEEVLKSE